MDIYKQVHDMNEMVYETNRLLFNHYKEELNEGITNQQAVLLDTIKFSPGITVGEVAKEMTISSSAVSQLLKKLEDSDYIERKSERDNKRIVKIYLAKKADNYYKKQLEVEKKVVDSIYKKLSQDELEQLYQLTEKIRDITLNEFKGDL